VKDCGCEVVIAMAGRGSRFADAGWATPKPLIPVNGVPMYELVARSLPITGDDHLIFVALAEHLGNGLAAAIQSAFGSAADVVALDDVTGGQSETVLLGLAKADRTRPLLVHNADTISPFNRAELFNDADGALVVFRAPGDHWSFARLGEGNEVVQVAEKRRISEWASTGAYFFRTGELFEQLATSAINDRRAAGGEYYVAPLYDDLLRSGGRVIAIEATEVKVLGTPAELQAYLDAG
jgi:NDP-sugar pyrophosphorylase family protein